MLQKRAFAAFKKIEMVQLQVGESRRRIHHGYKLSIHGEGPPVSQ